MVLVDWYGVAFVRYTSENGVLWKDECFNSFNATINYEEDMFAYCNFPNGVSLCHMRQIISSHVVSTRG